MIRFCDLREAYWLEPRGKPGPFAFIDTVTDTFVTIGGITLFSDMAHLRESIACHNNLDSRVARCFEAVPEELTG